MISLIPEEKIAPDPCPAKSYKYWLICNLHGLHTCNFYNVFSDWTSFFYYQFESIILKDTCKIG
jgi:hypothetical protein